MSVERIASTCPKCNREVNLRLEPMGADRQRYHGVCEYCLTRVFGAARSLAAKSRADGVPGNLPLGPPQTFVLWCDAGQNTAYTQGSTSITTYYEGLPVSVAAGTRGGEQRVWVNCPRCLREVECIVYVRDKWRKARDVALATIMAGVLLGFFGVVAAFEADSRGSWQFVAGITLLVIGCLVPMATFLICLRLGNPDTAYLIGGQSLKSEKEVMHRFSYQDGDPRVGQDTW